MSLDKLDHPATLHRPATPDHSATLDLRKVAQ